MNFRGDVYNKKLFLTFFLILLSIAIFNFSVDAFSIFNIVKIHNFNYIKPDKDRNQRITKVVSLKLEKRNIDAVFLGSSRVNSTISEDYYFKRTGNIAKNLGMNALSHDEIFKLAQSVVKIHPEIKTIYLGLDFFRFLEKNKDNKRDVLISDNPKLTIAEFNPLILSFNTTIASINTVIGNLRDKNIAIENKETVFFNKLRMYVYNYKDAILSDDEIKKIKLFKEMMNSIGYNVVIYTNPTHAIDLALIDKLGYLNLFFEWKEKLAKEFDYIDFAFVNDITAEKVDENTKYWLEISHASELTGSIIIDKMLFDSNNYGFLITNKNVKEQNIKNQKELVKYEKLNLFWMNQIETSIKNEV